MIDPPYPADMAAKGWSLDLDYERIDQSDTWALASAEQRPWLLMLWLVSWRQSPVASLPNNHRLISARLGMPEEQFTQWADVLLSGWELATDGRLYHRTLTEQVLKMAEKRVKDRSRVASYRAKSHISSDVVASCNALHTHDLRVSSAPPTTHHPPTPTPEKDIFSGNVVGAAVAAKPSAPKSARLPDDWALPKAWGEWALSEFPHWTPDAVRLEGQKFGDHWRTKSGKDGRKADWQAAWRNWCRSDIAQRAHALQRGGQRPGRMTDEERAAYTAAEGEKALRMVFGTGPPADHHTARISNIIDIEPLGISHEAG